jgi:hypothetical protein
MGGRSQTNDKQSSARISEPGDRPPPIAPVAIQASLVAGYGLTMSDQARTESTADHAGMETEKFIHLVVPKKLYGGKTLPSTGGSC